MPSRYTHSLPPSYDNWRTWTPCQDASDWECDECGAEEPSADAVPCRECDSWGHVPSEGARPIPVVAMPGHHTSWESVDDCEACEGYGAVVCETCDAALCEADDYEAAREDAYEMRMELGW